MARVPSLDTKDPLIGSFTGRQVVVLAVVGLAALGLYLLLSRISWVLGLAVAFPFGALGVAAVLAPKLDGLWGEQMIVRAVADHILARRRVWTPSGRLPRLPRRVSGLRQRVGGLRLPWRTLRADGDLDLGRHGLVRILRASSLDLELHAASPRRRDEPQPTRPAHQLGLGPWRILGSGLPQGDLTTPSHLPILRCPLRRPQGRSSSASPAGAPP